MRKIMAAILAGLLCASVQAQGNKPGEKAAAPAPPKVSQALIKKMRDCRKKTREKGLEGDERTLFLSRCIDGSDAAPRIAAGKAAEKARIRRETCVKTAMVRKLAGDELSKFLTKCQQG